jgi:hypothetical protein
MPRKTKEKFHAALISIDREGVDIHLLWGSGVNRKSVRAYADTIGYSPAKLPHNAAGVCFGIREATHGPSMIVTLCFDWVGNPSDYGVLTHELFHVVENVKQFIGVKYRRSCGEDWAYLLGDLVSSAVMALET